MTDQTAVRAGVAAAARYDQGAQISALIIAFAWHLAIDLPAMVDDWTAYRFPPVAGGCWLAYIGVCVVAGRRLLGGRDPYSWPLVAVLLVGDALVFAASPDTMLFRASNWGWSAIGWFALVVLWRRPVGALVAVLAFNALVALVALLATADVDRFDLSRYAMYVYGAGALQLALAVGARSLGSAAARAAESAQRQAAVELTADAADLAHQERRERYQRVRRSAGELLAALSSGDADPADPQVQWRCAAEAARLRRLIAESDDVPDPLLHELRACADLAERRGVTVDMLCLGELPALPVHLRRALIEPLATPLGTARGSARITVVAGPDEVCVSVLVDDGEPAVAGSADDRVSCTWEREEGRLWVQTSWRRA